MPHGGSRDEEAGCCGPDRRDAAVGDRCAEGGLALGAVAAATYPPYYAYAAPPAYYAPPPAVVYETAPAYTPPPPPAVQREVVYPHGRYVLYGDGVRQAWQWVWVPAAPAPPPPPPQH